MVKKFYGNKQFFQDSSKSRENAQKNMHKLIKSFLDYFAKKGYTKHPAVKISSGADSSVHFIGSHISVFKPYLEKEKVPTPGYILSQSCIRTQNLKKYSQKEYTFNWGSFFLSLGLIAPPTRLNEVIIESMDYIRNILKIDDKNLKIMINSKDKEFMNACKELKLNKFLEIDTKPLEYYRHKLGYENIFGKNFNFAIKDANKNEFADVGNIIIIEKDEKPVAVELALGTSTIIKQVCGLEHILDCTNIHVPIKDNIWLRRKIEDIIIVAVALYREGLRPSNKAKARILGDYIKTLSYLRSEAKISLEELKRIIQKYEKDNYPKDKKLVYDEIIDFINNFENKTTIYNQFVQRLKK